VCELFHFSYRFDETKGSHLCCGHQQCLASSEKVTKLLDQDVLQVQLCHRFASGEDRNQLKPENYRFIAYRNVFFLIHGRTKKKMSRLPLPSCIMMKVRSLFPDPENNYSGFKSKNQR
jgi:hypothetical protein